MSNQVTQQGERIKVALQQEHKKDDEAVERVLTLIERSPLFADAFFANAFKVAHQPPPQNNNQSASHSGLPAKLTEVKPKGKAPRALLAAIQSLLPSLPEVFTFHEVIAKLPTEHAKWGKENRRPALSTALRELAEEGELERIEKGSGVIPNKYRQVK